MEHLRQSEALNAAAQKRWLGPDAIREKEKRSESCRRDCSDFEEISARGRIFFMSGHFAADLSSEATITENSRTSVPRFLFAFAPKRRHPSPGIPGQG